MYLDVAGRYVAFYMFGGEWETLPPPVLMEKINILPVNALAYIVCELAPPHETANWPYLDPNRKGKEKSRSASVLHPAVPLASTCDK